MDSLHLVLFSTLHVLICKQVWRAALKLHHLSRFSWCQRPLLHLLILFPIIKKPSFIRRVHSFFINEVSKRLVVALKLLPPLFRSSRSAIPLNRAVLVKLKNLQRLFWRSDSVKVDGVFLLQVSKHPYRVCLAVMRKE